MIYLILIILTILLIDPVLDHRKIRQNIKILHDKEALHVMLVILGACLGAVIAGVHVLKIAAVVAMVPSVRWVIHDYGLNIIRGLPLSYLGKGEGAAKSDKLLAFMKDEFGVNGFLVRFLFLLNSTLISCLLCLFH
ncbi:MAG: hypothetical protein AAF587_29550 [Bacteroidota bacterium]